MTAIASLWLPILVSAVLVFLASSIIHMAPLWHRNELPAPPDGDRLQDAMRPFGHRDPGVLGAVMESDGVTAELIGDGAHVDYVAARVLLRAKGARNVALVTDGMPLAGTPDGDGAVAVGASSNIEAIGALLYGRYLFLFEAAGIILLVAMVGAIVLTHRQRSGVRGQNISRQVARRPDEATRNEKPEVGKGVSL